LQWHWKIEEMNPNNPASRATSHEPRRRSRRQIVTDTSAETFYKKIYSKKDSIQYLLILNIFVTRPNWTRSELAARFERKAMRAAMNDSRHKAEYKALAQKSTMAPRINELIGKGIIHAVTKRKCQVTGNLVEQLELAIRGEQNELW